MKLDSNKIKKIILDFLKMGNPLLAKAKNIPEDESLLWHGFIDSYAVIELIEFIEARFNIKIEDDEITPELFGSLNKMSKLVCKKINET